MCKSPKRVVRTASPNPEPTSEEAFTGHVRASELEESPKRTQDWQGASCIIECYQLGVVRCCRRAMQIFGAYLR